MTKEENLKIIQVEKATSAGIMKCLQALQLNKWDVEEAIKFLNGLK